MTVLRRPPLSYIARVRGHFGCTLREGVMRWIGVIGLFVFGSVQLLGCTSARVTSPTAVVPPSVAMAPATPPPAEGAAIVVEAGAPLHIVTRSLGQPPPWPGTVSPLAIIPFKASAPVWVDWKQVENLCAGRGYDCGLAGVLKAIRERGMVRNFVPMSAGIVLRLGSNGWPAAVVPSDGEPVWIDWGGIPGNCLSDQIAGYCHGAGIFLAIAEGGMTS